MKYKNRSEQDLIVAGRMTRAGEVFETDTPIEGNANFELVEDILPPAAAPVVPAAAPVVPAPVAAGVAAPLPTQGGVSQ